MKRTKKNFRKLIVFAMAFGLVTTVGYSLFKLSSAPPQVALIGSDERAITQCVSNLASFSANQACGEGGFVTYSYSCQNGKVIPVPTGSACLDFDQAYAQANSICGQTCSQPVPSPAPSGKPLPSCVPNPCADDRVCKIMSLPEGQVYCPRPSLPGNPSPTPVSTPTPRPASPTPTPRPGPQCDRQTLTYQQYEQPCGGGQTPPGHKVISFRCGSNSASPLFSTSLNDPSGNAQCVSENTLLIKAKQLCLDLTCNSPVPATPSPTASQLPAPPSGCYYQEPMMCIQLFGYECKPKLVCPTPSAKPVASPRASTGPLSSIAPSAQPVVVPTPVPAPIQRCYKLGPFRWCRTIKN